MTNTPQHSPIVAKKAALKAEIKERNNEIAELAGVYNSDNVLNYENLHSLMQEDLPEPNWILPDLLPEGLALFVGGSKLGKSWIGLNMALAVACGGYMFDKQCSQGKVLYLALEDSKRRIQSRYNKLIKSQNADSEALKNIDFTFRLQHQDGVLITPDKLPDALKTAITGKNYKLIVIDTLGRLKQHHKGSKNMYDAETQLIAPFQELAIDNGVCILLIHHTNKSKSEDSFDRVSGSTALMGVADTTWILERPRMDEVAKLSITGRDVSEQELALKIDTNMGTFNVLGDAKRICLPEQQKEVLAVLTDDAWLTTDEVVEKLGDVDRNTTKTQLNRLVDIGVIEKRQRQDTGKSNPPMEYKPS